jgi:hypothetical protein
MNTEKEKARDRNTIRFFGIMIPSFPSLMFRLGGTFLRFKRDAKKAGKIFRKELIKQGFDKKIATNLTNSYLEGSNLIKYMQNF